MALPDEAFTLEDRNTVEIPNTGTSTTGFGVRHYISATGGEWVNLEISNRSGVMVIDTYIDPEDLDRLGVLLQYVAKQALDKQKETEQKR